MVEDSADVGKWAHPRWQFLIRDATADDEASCAALLAELRGGGDSDPRLTDVFGMLLSKERGQITVAVEDGTVLGMATVSFNLALRYGGEYCQLEELIVSPRARGRNLGGRLVQAVVEIASARGCAEIGLYLLESTEHNRPLLRQIRIRGRWQRDAPAFERLGASLARRVRECFAFSIPSATCGGSRNLVASTRYRCLSRHAPRPHSSA